MTPSSEHENYAKLIERLVVRMSALLRIKTLFFGSSTIKSQSQGKGAEPDGRFYVQGAALIGNKIRLDFNNDPPPEIVVEVDLTHESLVKFPIYAAFGVPEVWRYDGRALTIHHLQYGQYVATRTSCALPVLTMPIRFFSGRDWNGTVSLPLGKWRFLRYPGEKQGACDREAG